MRAVIFSREKAENDRLAREAFSRKEGLEEGLQKGFEKAAEEIAWRMNESGMSLLDISTLTNLSIDQLKKLLNQ